MPDEPDIYGDAGYEWTCAEWNGIRMQYMWDGDGCLEFHLDDNTLIYNSDCKNSHGWEIVRALELEKEEIK